MQDSLLQYHIDLVFFFSDHTSARSVACHLEIGPLQHSPGRSVHVAYLTSGTDPESNLLLPTYPAGVFKQRLKSHLFKMF